MAEGDGEKTVECCYSCKHFAEFREPREIGALSAVYGYCYKRGGIISALPVYVPGARCKDWTQRRAAKRGRRP